MEEIITIKIHKDKLNMLIESDALAEGEWLVVKAEVPDFDYSQDKAWQAAKDKSNKAYKELKIIEYNIRNK